MNIPRFHMAFPVIDLESTRKFYSEVLGCTLGRESNKWIDFNLFGHQIVAHFPQAIVLELILIGWMVIWFHLGTLVLFYLGKNGKRYVKK